MKNVDMMEEEIIQNKFKILFERRSAAILDKTRRRKKKFMESLAEETTVLARQLAAPDQTSGLTCCLSQQPLTDAQTYFQIGAVCPTNVIHSDLAACYCRGGLVAGTQARTGGSRRRCRSRESGHSLGERKERMRR